MTVQPPRLLRDLPRALWLLATLFLVTGYYLIDTHYERAIAASLSASEHYSASIAANEHILRESVRLSLLRKHVELDLAHLRAQNAVTSTVQLLQALEIDGHRFGTTVVAIQPAQTPQLNKDETNGLAGTDLTIRLSGHFRGILMFVEDLPRRHVLLTVQGTEMRLQDSASAASSDPVLDATIHATLFTLRALPEETHALAR